MWLLDKMLRKVITKGELVVTDHDGKVYRYGAPDPAIRSVTCPADRQGRRLPHRQGPAGRRRRGLYGRPAGDRAAGRHPRPRPAHPLQRAGREAGRAEAQGADPQGDRLSPSASSTRSTGRRARAATPSIPTTSPGGSTSCSSTRTGNIPWPITATPANSLEQAQLDKKAHIASKLYLKPGMKVLDIGCGWGGLALYLHRHYDVDVLGVALAPDQIEFCNERAAEAGRRRPGQVRADGLSRRRPASSTGSPASA